MPASAARSRASEPDEDERSSPGTEPSTWMAKSTEQIPFCPSRADSGITSYQFCRTTAITRLRYGPKSTPRVSERTCMPPIEKLELGLLNWPGPPPEPGNCPLERPRDAA